MILVMDAALGGLAAAVTTVNKSLAFLGCLGRQVVLHLVGNHKNNEEKVDEGKYGFF